jgi:peptidoglycan/LPS O-acetylase OafA/YrhL
MGTVRFLLAMLVVVFHIAHIPMVGYMAVQAFFVLSGYLMTHIMHTNYAYSWSGFGRFWTNRILRLYPIYLALIGLSAIAFYFIGDEATRRFAPAVYMPDTAREWAQNLTFLYVNWLPLNEMPRLSESSWALTVEMVYYFLISLGLSRTRLITWIWFAGAIVWYAFVFATAKPYSWGYHHIVAGALPFSLGALLWHYREMIDEWLSRWRPEPNRIAFLLILTGFGILFAASGIRAVMYRLGASDTLAIAVMFVHAFAATILVAGTVRVKVPAGFKQADRLAGDLSYPVYVSHFAFAIIAAQLTGIQEPDRSLHGFLNAGVAIAMMLVVCIILIHLIDRPIERLRERVRGRAVMN